MIFAAPRPDPEQTVCRALQIMVAAPEGECTWLESALERVAPSVQVVGRAESESAAMRLYFQVNPDVAVLDTRLVADEPARLIGLLSRVAPGLRIISVVPALDSMPARAAAALGADMISTEADLPAAIAQMASYPLD